MHDPFPYFTHRTLYLRLDLIGLVVVVVVVVVVVEVLVDVVVVAYLP